MKRRKLGALEVSAIGLGCMSMTPIYGTPDPDEAIATIHRALELGVDMIDTSDAYGAGKNEELVGRALKGRRDKAILATKFGNIQTPNSQGVNGRPEYVIEACEMSLKRLGLDMIDLYYIHRVDTDVPIEDTVGAMVKLKQQGKIRFLGISEAAPATLRRAHKAHPMACLQTEYSLWTRDAEDELLKTCEELGVGYVAYSPLGRGFLTGTIGGLGDLGENDRRRQHPRFQAENLNRNVNLLKAFNDLAAKEKCTPAQLAIAWVLSRKPYIVALPGTSHRKYLEQNVQAADLTLSPQTISALDKAFPRGVAAGARYPEPQLKRVGV
ncbi:MAG: aldo/keto reductase [Stellaceae bacterium]|jgi:aryl-alcohol dehydrogenase-like predicted oxidoreductase